MREDWIEVKLSDVLFQSKEKHKPEAIENLFYIGLEHIAKTSGLLTKSAGLAEIKTVKNIFSKGQILYGKLRPYLNKVYLAKESGVCSTDILVFKVSNALKGKLALQFMLSRKFVNDMAANTNGVNLPRVSTQYVNNYPFPLPPLPEQRAIVAKIEELFSDLDQGIADLTKAQAQLKVYRQAVLKKAFEGEYTQKNIQYKSSLINGIQSSIPKNWTICALGDLVKLQGGFAFKSAEYKKSGIPIVKIKNVQFQDIDWSEKTFIEKSRKEEFKDYLLKKGDVLIAMTRPVIKSLNNVKTVIVRDYDLPALLNQRVGRFLIKGELNREYLKYFIFTDFFKTRVIKESSSSQQPNISSTKIEKFDFIVPDTLKEQNQIVKEIESRLSVCDNVEQSIIASLEKAKALRQSILKKAFEGTLLTPAEIAKCKLAEDYEPASVLLERIKEEKIKK